MNNIRAWIGLIGLSLMASIAFLDFTIVYTSLPAIQVGLNVPVIKLQLIMSVFGLAVASFMIFTGKLADQFGKRKIFFIGSFIFAIAALGAGFSTNFDMLIFFRFVQGFSVAIIFTSSSLLAPLSFKEEQQPLAISIYTGITGLGLASGPFFGGLIVNSFGWQWIFFINVPIVLLGFILCLGNVKETKKQPHIKHDIPGLILFVAGLSLLIFFLSYSNTLGWASISVISGLSIAVFLLLSLIFVEKRQPSPLLDINDISNPKVLLAIFICLSASVMTGILMLFIPLYLSSVLAYSSLVIGFFMLATPIMQVIVSVLWAKLSKYLGIGTIVIAAIIACLMSSLIMSFFTLQTSALLVITALGLMGIIWGVTNAACITLATTAIPEERASGVMGLIFTSWNVGACVLIALSSVIFSEVEFSNLQTSIQKYHLQLNVEDHHKITAVLAAPEKALAILKELSPEALSHELFPLFKQSFLSGFHAVMYFASFLLLLCLLACIKIIRKYKIE